MRIRERAIDKSGGKAGVKRMAMASAAPKRIGTAGKSAPVKKAAKPAKKAVPAKAKKPAAAKKPAPAKKAASAPLPAQASKSAAAPKLAPPGPSVAPAVKPAVAAAVRPAPTAARPAASAASAEERRKAATRKFFARLRSLEAIVGADLRKRGSVVLMQAVDQWYNEAISANATDVSITNAAKVVIAHL